MSESIPEAIPEDLAQATAPRRPDAALLLAVGETRAAAQQAAQTSSRVEHAVSGLTLRVGALEIDVATIKAQQAARQEAEDRVAPPKVHPTTYLSLGISVLLAILILIQDFSLPSSP